MGVRARVERAASRARAPRAQPGHGVAAAALLRAGCGRLQSGSAVGTDGGPLRGAALGGQGRTSPAQGGAASSGRSGRSRAGPPGAARAALFVPGCRPRSCQRPASGAAVRCGTGECGAGGRRSQGRPLQAARPSCRAPASAASLRRRKALSITPQGRVSRGPQTEDNGYACASTTVTDWLLLFPPYPIEKSPSGAHI